MNRCMYFYLKLYFGYVCILRCYLNFVVICKVCSLEENGSLYVNLIKL